jgi:hypothetical protein
MITGYNFKIIYEVEAEKNKLYKLIDDGYIVAPFCDLNDLFRFILT